MTNPFVSSNILRKNIEKEGDSTEELTANLLEELNCTPVFEIPVFGGIAVNPGKVQLALESAVGWAQDFFEGIIGKENRRYVPYLICVSLYIAVSNLIGLTGFKPPTKDLNVTVALAIMSMLLIEYSGIHRNGLKQIFIRPLSLCMRLFGNMLGGFVVMELVKLVVPLIVPIPLSFYFDIFDGLLQAYVFVFLTALFMNEEME